jgi:hypothetical protein
VGKLEINLAKAKIASDLQQGEAPRPRTHEPIRSSTSRQQKKRKQQGVCQAHDGAGHVAFEPKKNLGHKKKTTLSDKSN